MAKSNSGPTHLLRWSFNLIDMLDKINIGSRSSLKSHLQFSGLTTIYTELENSFSVLRTVLTC